VVSLVHLKGTEGVGTISAAVIARFIAGYGVEAAIFVPSGALLCISSQSPPAAHTWLVAVWSAGTGARRELGAGR